MSETTTHASGEANGSAPERIEGRAPGFWRAMWLVSSLELKQRLRSKTLWILAVVWFCIIGIVTAATWATISLNASAYDESFDAFPIFSIIVYFVLLFGTLLAPALSAGSISSERSGGTLATTQVTLIGTWPILLGKALAAWITALAFLVVASPFIILSLALAKTTVLQLFMALLALAIQLALFTTMGVGFSALISSSLFSIVVAYLVVALLSIGTLIAFALSVGVGTRYVEVEYRTFSQGYWEASAACGDDKACLEAVPVECVTETVTSSVSPTDKVWWILAMNPYVVVADMVATQADLGRGGDMFSLIAYSVRSLQIEGGEPTGWTDCPNSPPYVPTEDTLLDDTLPVWWMGLGIQTALSLGVLFAGYRRLHTPAAKIPKGSRVA